MTSTHLLWPGAAVGAIADEPADHPTVTIHRPERPDGSAIIICPGGGYVFHADYEADPVAQWLTSINVTGIVLRYRLAPRYRHPIPFIDLSRAIRLVRSRADEWGIDAGRIGVMGFSAGGHLAAHVSTQCDHGDPAASDPVDRFSSRPDLAVLLYPVITFTGASSHTATMRNLIGDAPPNNLIDRLSCERYVTCETPPSFIYHASGDPNVPVINAMIYADALRANGASFEMHLYDRIAHGVGLAANDPYLGTWPRLCASWLKRKGFGLQGVA